MALEPPFQDTPEEETSEADTRQRCLSVSTTTKAIEPRSQEAATLNPIWEFPTIGGPNVDPKIVGLLF